VLFESLFAKSFGDEGGQRFFWINKRKAILKEKVTEVEKCGTIEHWLGIKADLF
jgi:hypothetical protein